MMGFEMAYVPSGSYYVATAQQVIDEEKRGKLTELHPKVEIIAQASVLADPSADVSHIANSITTPIVAKFPFDSYIPFEKAILQHDLERLKGVEVAVTGYASSEGTKSYNKQLSKKRALKIAQIAKKLGVKVKSISAVGERECGVKSYKKLPQCRKVEVVPVAESDHP